jgi:hypothetical protein
LYRYGNIDAAITVACITTLAASTRGFAARLTNAKPT